MGGELLRHPWLRHYVLPLLLATALLFVVRGCVVRQYVLREDFPGMGLVPGDRLLVGLYDKSPEVGEPTAFKLRKSICFDRPLACPGDTLWISFAHHSLSHHRNDTTDEMLILPRKGETMSVTPRNAALFAKALCRYEDVRTDLTPDSRLLLRGEEVKTVTFTHDLYWMRHTSPSEGLIASSAIIGTPLLVTYSIKPNGTWRWERTATSLSSLPQKEERNKK